ncbi:MAG: DUF4253 domain-containing protein [Saprospiraceae bacterium]|nr:DUF4253 domain-containing protein [Saprospiraceae bacterium]
MSKLKLLNEVAIKLNLLKYGFEPSHITYAGDNVRYGGEDLNSRNHHFSYINDQFSNDIKFHLEFTLIISPERMYFKGTFFLHVLFKKIKIVMYKSNYVPLVNNTTYPELDYDVRKSFSHLQDQLPNINFRSPTGKIDDEQLDKAISVIHSLMDDNIMPFFDSVSTIEKVNTNIIDKYEDTDWDNLNIFIHGWSGAKKIIFMKLGNNKRFEEFKSWYLDLVIKTSPSEDAPEPTFIKNILCELEKVQTDPHYFDYEVPDDTRDDLKPNARHLVELQKAAPKEPVKKSKDTTALNTTRFSSDELEIITDAGIDATAIDIIHDYKIGLLSPSLSDSDGDEYIGIEIEGISYPMDIEGFEYLRDTINPQLQSVGYKAYITSWPDRQTNHYTITVIPRGDDMDILRYQYTNGINHSLGPDEIITKLKYWRDHMNLSILGAGYDWVAFSMSPFPSDLDGFISELIAFCPDYLEQDFYSAQGLDHSRQQIKDFIRQYGFVRLWWD